MALVVLPPNTKVYAETSDTAKYSFLTTQIYGPTSDVGTRYLPTAAATTLKFLVESVEPKRNNKTMINLLLPNQSDPQAQVYNLLTIDTTLHVKMFAPFMTTFNTLYSTFFVNKNASYIGLPLDEPIVGQRVFNGFVKTDSVVVDKNKYIAKDTYLGGTSNNVLVRRMEFDFIVGRRR